MARGLLDYFPDALAYVAYVSKVGNDQHNPGQELHWAKEKSTDHADCIIRHLVDRGTTDSDGVLHSGKTAWRALALLQTELEAAEAKKESSYISDPRTTWDSASGKIKQVRDGIPFAPFPMEWEAQADQPKRKWVDSAGNLRDYP
jgi:hypothetical protein